MKKSTGFRSNSSQGFSKTLSKPLAEKISPFDKTWKNEKSIERKQLIQNYFGINYHLSLKNKILRQMSLLDFMPLKELYSIKDSCKNQ